MAGWDSRPAGDARRRHIHCCGVEACSNQPRTRRKRRTVRKHGSSSWQRTVVLIKSENDAPSYGETAPP